MTLAVGFGYTMEYLLDLPLPAFDALVSSLLRTRRAALAEMGIVMHLAAQGETKILNEHLRALVGDKRQESAEHKAAKDEMNRGKSGGRRGRR